MVHPYIEVVSPLVDGNHQAPWLLLELARIAIEVVPGVEPECPLGQHASAVDQLWLDACCVVRDLLQHGCLID